MTDRDWDNREVRRPTSIGDLIAVVSGVQRFGNRGRAEAAVRIVLSEFAADGRAFIVVNAQEHVDISHESLIRKWMLLRAWLDQENQSRRIYIRLADTASKWQEGSASLYRGPELAAADGWWKRESPSQAWADRYDSHFESAKRFLQRSVLQRRLRWSMAAVGAVLTILIAVLTTALWLRASQAEKRAIAAETDAKNARNEAVKAADELKEARALEAKARDAEANGNAALAESLKSKAQQLTEQSNGRQVLTPGEAHEIERLRAAALDNTAQINKLQSQYEDITKRFDASSVDVSRLKEANAALVCDRDALNDQLIKARTDLKAAADERTALMAKLDDAIKKQNPTTEPRAEGNYRDIYERAITLKNRSQWRDAEKQFEAAVRLKGDTGEPVAMQGVGTEPYLPNYQLAFVRRQLACEALQRAEKDGGYKVLKDTSTFADQLKACQAR